MSPMDYTADGWVAPWTPGLEQARCRGRLCQGEGNPGSLVVAITLDDAGLCANCRRTPASIDDYQLGAEPALDALIQGGA